MKYIDKREQTCSARGEGLVGTSGFLYKMQTREV